MKTLFNTALLFFLFVYTGLGQIDTSFYMAKYPTGQDGFVRDIESFASVTQAEKDTLDDHEVEITLWVMADGKIGDAYAKGNVSQDLIRRVEEAITKLHDFIPARRLGKNVESTFNMTLVFNRYFPQQFLIRDTSDYKEGNIGWSLDWGGYIGSFSGKIEEVYGLNGGIYFGTGIVFDNSQVNFDFGIGGAEKNGDFVLPPEVTEQSNDAHFYYGLSYSKFFDVNSNQIFRTKLGIGGYSVNAGIITEANLFRFAGFDLFGELAYAFKVGEQTSTSYYNVSRFKHYIVPYVQTHLWAGDEQTQGLFFNVGLKYSLEIFGMKMKDNK